jgi:DNA-binding Lrp family transcriptional regulator
MLDELARRLLDEFQSGFPLVERPYQMIAERLGVEEAEVIATVAALREGGYLARVGGVLPPRRFGASTLAAIAVPRERLDEVAALVSAYPEVNHNYEREHAFNLWFVVAAPDSARVAQVLREINERTGLPVLDLPLLESFHIDLGFRLQWTSATKTAGF